MNIAESSVIPMSITCTGFIFIKFKLLKFKFDIVWTGLLINGRIRIQFRLWYEEVTVLLIRETGFLQRIFRDCFAVAHQVEEAVELEYPLILLEPLALLLNHMVEQICTRLSARAFATQELRLRLELETRVHTDEESAIGMNEVEARSPLFTRTLNLPLPMLDAKVFLKLLQLDLNAHPPGAPIKKVWLAAEPVRWRAAQGGLPRASPRSSTGLTIVILHRIAAAP